MMPQTLKIITPEYAKSHYGFVIDNTLPFTPQSEPEDGFRLIRSGGNVPPLIDAIQPDAEPVPIVQRNVDPIDDILAVPPSLGGEEWIDG
jgi:hypothetical protein